MTTATPQEIEYIKSMALFTGLNLRQMEHVIQQARRRQVDADTYIHMQSDPADMFYVLLSGRVKLTQVTVDGQQIILRYVTPGEAFGVIAVLQDIGYPVSAQTVEKSFLLVWDRAIMRNIMENCPTVAINAIGILAEHIHEFQDRVRELSTERVERRIARTLLRLAQQTGRKMSEGVLIDLPLSRQDLAEMTGTTVYTVSRALSHWETLGLIKSNREQVIICFPHGLVTIAEDLPIGRRTPLPKNDDEIIQ